MINNIWSFFSQIFNPISYCFFWLCMIYNFLTFILISYFIKNAKILVKVGSERSGTWWTEASNLRLLRITTDDKQCKTFDVCLFEKLQNARTFSMALRRPPTRIELRIEDMEEYDEMVRRGWESKEGKKYTKCYFLPVFFFLFLCENPFCFLCFFSSPFVMMWNLCVQQFI